MVDISIVTTVYNAADTIQDCLESVCGQDHPVEHVIVDGGSTDGTLEIIKEFQDDLAVVVSEKDNGIYDGMNKGLRLATGKIIGILNADDLYCGPDILTKVIEVFKNENVDSCYGDLVYVSSLDIDKVVRFWRSGRFDVRRFYWGWMPPHPTFFVRRKIYEKYGAFNLELGSAADYELMLRFLLKHKISSSYIPQILVKMRDGGVSNASFRQRLRAHNNDRRAWKVNSLNPYPWTLLLKPLSKVHQFFITGNPEK